MSRALPIILILAATFAIGTALLGWWAVPVVAGAAGYLLGRNRAPGILAGIGAALAWGGILLSYRVIGLPIGVLTRRLAGAMQLPQTGLVTLSILFPALLAGAAAALGGHMRGVKVTSPRTPPA
jgi:hypothetical protein